MSSPIRLVRFSAYTDGFTFWNYKSLSTPMSAVKADMYFQDAAHMLAVGDMILASAEDASALLVVTATGDRVTTHSMTT